MSEPAGARWRDRGAEALAELASRPLRMALTGMGTLLGVATLVATVGLAATVRAQVGAGFDRYAATEVVVEAAVGVPTVDAFPADHEDRLRRLPGVVDLGRAWEVDTGGRGLRREWDPGPLEPSANLVAVDPGALAVIEPRVVQGRAFDRAAEARAAPVVLLSTRLARALGVTSVRGAPQVFLGDVPLTVVGTFDAVHRQPGALLGALVPAATAEALFGGGAVGAPRLLVEVEPGAAPVVARQAGLALAPEAPERFAARPPLDPRHLRRQVDDDLTLLFVALGGLSLLVGSASIASVTLVSVLERVPEIGLRRALGARPVDVVGQVLVEATATGALAGIVGTALGVVAVAGVALAAGWTLTLDPTVVLAAPLLATATGLLAGVHPARRAARVAPTTALRS